MRRLLIPALILIAMTTASAQQPAELRTRAELTNYEETSSHADVQRVTNGLAASSPLVHAESFGTTEEGRELPLLVISDPKVTTPAAARKLGRPLVFVQANIPAGEVEGKEAVLVLARRLVSGDLKPLTRELVILIAPNYNADGNEKVNLQNRAAQYGPVAGVGTRENAKGLDLNRDYMKLDSVEARALVGLMNKWDPHVLVDLHTTNGSYHANHLTYSPILNPNADARLIEFTRERMLAPIRAAMLKDHNWRTYYYGNFAPEDGSSRDSSRVDPANPGNVTWRTFDHRPRFGNNYAG
ncbi:MAG: M14 family zinc carboxypeptidase, partial [Acidobacteriota bacterium]|nr:M14 family zinc carboxypeptidase [Acidobacteriota bacterium]